MKKSKDKKPTIPNPLQTEELFDYLNELIESSGAQSEEELRGVFNSIMGQSIEKVRKRVKMTPRLEAKNLMYGAYDLPVRKGREIAAKALEIYPDCVDAFIYYGDICEDIEEALGWYRKAVEAGERDIGDKRFKEDAGHFWGVNVTRPYMRARELYASTLTLMDRIDEAIVEYQEMLKLNPTDNQGIRFELAPLLMMKRRYKEYFSLYKQYKNESMSGWLYTHFLYLFTKHGAVKKTQEVLLEAISENPYIIEYLCNIDVLPMEPDSEFYSPGDETEAYIYLESSLRMWLEHPKALGYLFNFWMKYKEQN